MSRETEALIEELHCVCRLRLLWLGLSGLGLSGLGLGRLGLRNGAARSEQQPNTDRWKMGRPHH